MVRRACPWHLDDGAPSVEYALVLFAVAATVVVTLFALGGPLFDLYEGACRAVKDAASAPGSSC